VHRNSDWQNAAPMSLHTPPIVDGTLLLLPQPTIPKPTTVESKNVSKVRFMSHSE
jgi:hypothetical protein